jgi:hypothetical protein
MKFIDELNNFKLMTVRFHDKNTTVNICDSESCIFQYTVVKPPVTISVASS